MVQKFRKREKRCGGKKRKEGQKERQYPFNGEELQPESTKDQGYSQFTHTRHRHTRAQLIGAGEGRKIFVLGNGKSQRLGKKDRDCRSDRVAPQVRKKQAQIREEIERTTSVRGDLGAIKRGKPGTTLLSLLTKEVSKPEERRVADHLCGIAKQEEKRKDGR